MKTFVIVVRTPLFLIALSITSFKFRNLRFEGTVVVISRNTHFNKGHVRFTTDHLKPLSDQYWDRKGRFYVKDLIMINNTLFSCIRNAKITFAEKPQLKIITCQNFAYI